MKKSFIIIIIAIVAIIGAAGLVQSETKNKSSNTMDMTNNTKSTATADNKSAVANQIVIKNFAFSPAKISVKRGTKVTWVNQDDAHHDITPSQPGNDFVTSQLLAKGESYNFTFERVGTYAYHCSPHPYMKATVEVTE